MLVGLSTGLRCWHYTASITISEETCPAKDVTKSGTGNGETRTGVWERVYSGNPHEKSKRLVLG